MNEQDMNLGKKIFFLNPHSIIKEDLITTILYNEYEVYFLTDETQAIRLCKKFRNSLLFVNIDAKLANGSWESLVTNILTNPDTKGVLVGILTTSEDNALKEKYLMKIGVQAGFIQLKMGVKDCTKIILKMLEANEAKGRRKYVRAINDDPSLGNFNVRVSDRFEEGIVQDISSVGMAVTFKNTVNLPKNALLKEIQLKLKGTIGRTDGIVLGFRGAEKKTYILLFTPKINGKTKENVYRFIHHALQKNIANL